jgi:hypothetical protein
VEVVEKTPKIYKFSVDSLSGVITVGGSSLPLAMTLTNSPAADVSVNINVVDGLADLITVSPLTLTFNKEVNTRYFQISVDSAYDVKANGTTQTLAFALTGTDRYAYDIDPVYTFNIVDSINDSGVKIASADVNTWGVTDCTRTTCKAKPNISDHAVVYWYLSVTK